MTARFYKIITVLAVLTFAFVLALVLVDDYDVWWHLKCGELLLKEGWIPREETFSYTAAGSPWVDGYLPAQVLLYVSWWVAGPAGLCLLSATLVAGTYALSLVMSRRGAGFSVALASSLPAVLLARGVMLPRPALLTPIFALLTLWLLEDYRRNGGKRIWWLIPLTSIWANCHPAFLLGLILTAIYLTGNLVSIITRADRKSSNCRFSIYDFRLKKSSIFNLQSSIFFLILPAQILATLINPYGHRIYYSTASLIANPQLTEFILEWKPLLGKPKETPGTVECYILIVALGLGCFLWSRSRARIEHLIAFGFIALTTALARRNLLLFGALSIPLLTWIIDEGARGRKEAMHVSGAFMVRFVKVIDKGLKPIVLMLAIFLIWFAATNRLYFHFNHLRSTGIGIHKGVFPERAVELLLRENVKGNIFHTYSLGGYLIFNLYPKYHVYIDGRVYPYPFEVFHQGKDALRSTKAFERIRSRYDIRAVLIPHYPPKTWPMIMALIRAPDWAVVHASGTAVLFLERGAGNDAIISKYELDLFSDPPQLHAPPVREYGLLNHAFGVASYPYGPIRWAKLYERLDRPDLAARALKPALNYRPLVKNIDAWFGVLLIQAGRQEEGIVYIRQALKNNPDNIVALSGLAEYHINHKDYERADEILNRLTDIEPDAPRAWISMGEMAYNRAHYGEAARRFRNALKFEPENAETWEKLGKSFKQFDALAAKEAFEKSLHLIEESGGSPDDIERIREHLRNLN